MRIVANVAAVAGRGGRRASVIAVGALTIASCSGSGGADPAPPELSAEPLTSTSAGEDVTESVVPTTSSGPTSTQEPAAPSTDASPSTTTEPTTAPTEPVAPTTTTLEDLRAEIEADLNEGEAVFLAGAADPGSESSRRDLEKYFAEEGLTTLLDFYESLETADRRARPSSDAPSVTRVLEIYDSAGDEATILRCRIDAAVVYEEDAAGSEIVVNDEIGRFFTRSKVLFTGGIWRLAGGQTISVELGESTCDDQ